MLTTSHLRGLGLADTAFLFGNPLLTAALVAMDRQLPPQRIYVTSGDSFEPNSVFVGRETYRRLTKCALRKGPTESKRWNNRKKCRQNGHCSRILLIL